MIYSGDELVILARVYMKATGMSPTKLGELTARHNRLIDRLLAGHDCLTHVAEKASDWFDRNWPTSVPWPLAAGRRNKLAA